MTDSSGLDYFERVRLRLNEGLQVTSELLSRVDQIVKIADTLVGCYRDRKKVFLFGNGGSAADAQHIATELVGRFYLERPSLPAEALTVNTSSLTAIANDYAFAEIFARQIEGLGNAGDVAIGLSTSGNSENVVRGLRAARAKGLVAVAFTGEAEGKVGAESDICFCVPSRETPRIQEAHILVGHILCEIVERTLFGEGGA